MRRTLLTAALAAVLLVPVAHADDVLFFQDDFNREDEIPIISWSPFGVGFGGPTEEPGYSLGANMVSLEGNAMVFRHMTGGDSSATRYEGLSVFVPASMPSPPTIRFSFTPGNAQVDFLLGVSFPGSTMCNFPYLTSEAPLATGPLMPCETPFVARIQSDAFYGGGGTRKRDDASARAAGVGENIAPPSVTVPFRLMLGGVAVGEGPYFYSNIEPVPAEFNLVAGQTYQVEYSIFFLGDSVGSSLTVSDGTNTVRAEAMGAGGPRKTSRMAQFSSTEIGADYAFFIAEPHHNLLRSMDSSYTVTQVQHRFDDVVITESHEPGTELETIEVEVEAKGRFKKQPIDIKKKGRMQATVYGESGFDVTDIDMSTVTFGATGTETPALDVSYADVNRDGRQDAIFDFAKGTAITPCGTTAVTMMGEGYFEGSRVRFTGTDSRVRVTGCPR